MEKGTLRKINDCLWEIPKDFRADMRVPARIYASEKMLQEIEDEAITQLVNTTTLPGITKYAIAMPDIHSGYGPPIGGIGAMKLPEGLISPGFVGYDENCGIRLLLSEDIVKEVSPYLDKLATEIYREVPSGVGKASVVKLSTNQINKVLEGGVSELVRQGYGEREDVENCEERGRMDGADASYVSLQAKARGRDQLGTLGSGNHFCEVQVVDELFDEGIAQTLGLFKNQIAVMIHTGSRGLGHQNATDYLRIAVQAMSKYKIKLPDREFAGFPFNSTEGQGFLKALSAASNFAWSNRQMITYHIRRVWSSIFSKRAELKLLYDVSHNIAKVEEHTVAGGKMKVIVHRKGATRAFPPGNSEIPEKYKDVGQPVLIPGSMGTASYILVGTNQAMEDTFGSSCHGAGRRMSRHAAKRQVRGAKLKQELEGQGIVIRSGSLSGLAEEAPLAYKDVEEVVEVVHRAGIAKKVARLKPLVVVKG